MVYFGNSDGRVCIVFAYLGKVLAGSTDIKVESTERVRCEDDERDYILASLRLVFPTIDVSVDQVVYTVQRHSPAGEERPRHHGTHVARAFPAASRCDRSTLLHDRRKVDDVPGLRRTHDGCRIGGARTAAHDRDVRSGHRRRARLLRRGRRSRRNWCAHSVSRQQRAAHLADTYGTRATEVMAFCARAPRRPAARRRHRTDRRGDRIPHAAGIRGAPRRLDPAPHDARDHRHDRRRAYRSHRIRRGRELGWDEARRRAEIEELVADLENYHGVDRRTLGPTYNRKGPPQCI